MRGEAFERLYATHSEQLVKFLLYRTGDTALAEDLAADTFERVIRARRPFDPRRGAEKAWLYAIALNLVRDHHRRSGAEERALERTSASAERAESSTEADHVDLRDEISRALSSLSADEREAVALRYGADLPVREIARLVDEKAGTVEKRLYRALGKLRGQLPSLAEGS
jgi:RNA polymerase sigma factor (sigma-70 family)